MTTLKKDEPKLIDKKVSHAFGKDIYLLGKDTEGAYLWLESPKWDCGWYWGFGYIERYTNNRHPHLAKDISSHTHWDSEITGKRGSDYIHHLNDNPNIVETVLTDKESWELADLMKSFYLLKNMAEFYRHGYSYISKPKVTFQNTEKEKEINEKLLPEIFKRIDEILTPNKKGE